MWNQSKYRYTYTALVIQLSEETAFFFERSVYVYVHY